MTGRTPEDVVISERAAEWLFLLQETGNKHRAAFAEWLKESPKHVEEFLAITALNHHLDTTDWKREEYAEFRREANARRRSRRRVVMLHDHPLAVARRAEPANWTTQFHDWQEWMWERLGWSPWKFGVLGTAATILIAVLTWGAWMQLGWQEYHTTIGEQRAFELADGSLLHLNTRSRVRVHFTDHERSIRLLEGEALFRVAKDPLRPFLVSAKDMTIQAVGTQFNVYNHDGGETTVAVIEGKVRISKTDEANPAAPADDAAPALTASKGKHAKTLVTVETGSVKRQTNVTAGQQVTIKKNGELSVKNVDTMQTLAWRQRRLVFNQTTLSQVAEEFNRYNDKPQMQVIGQTAYKKLSGVFDADDPESLVQFLQSDKTLLVSEQADALIITERE
jgi:transmembrane sensor